MVIEKGLGDSEGSGAADYADLAQMNADLF